jgi:hypothetical protein
MHHSFGFGAMRVEKAALAITLAFCGVALASAPALAATNGPTGPALSVFEIAAKPTPGEYVGTIPATNSPTWWAIGGSSAATLYFRISAVAGGGKLTVGPTAPPSGTYSFLAEAKNSYGSWLGRVSVIVDAIAPVAGQCGSANLTTVSTAPTSGLCSAGTASSVSGTGPWTWTCAGSNGGATASCSASLSTQSSGSSSSSAAMAWSNYPQSPNYFPTVLWWQDLGTPIPGYTSFLAAMRGTGMNTLLNLNKAGGGGWWGPSSFGVDNSGYLAQIAAAGIYLIPQVNSISNAPYCSGGCIGNLSPNNTDVNSVASYKALISNTGIKSTIIGFELDDEPQTGSCDQYPMSGIPGQIAIYKGYDSTRPFFMNSNPFVTNGGLCNPMSLDYNYMAAISVGSFDTYPLVNPSLPAFIKAPSSTTTPADTLWIQGYIINKMMALRSPGAPFWAWVDSGSDVLASFSSWGYTCPATTNTCSNGTYTIWHRAPANLVNAEVWMSIINGATGIEYFCQDSTATYAYCMGQGGSAGALAAQANVTYINLNLQTYAPMLNSATAGMCTMNNGTTLSSFTTSCSNGILTMSTGTPTVPGAALVKSYNGATYLIAQPDRYGSAAFTFTLTGLAGKTATVVYDSNSRYDSGHASLGATYVLNSSAQFVDTLGANGDNYQVKIYKIQ